MTSSLTTSVVAFFSFALSIFILNYQHDSARHKYHSTVDCLACKKYTLQSEIHHGYRSLSANTAGVEIALIRLSGLGKKLSGQVDRPTEVIRCPDKSLSLSRRTTCTEPVDSYMARSDPLRMITNINLHSFPALQTAPNNT